jgi:DNA-binding MarR family transcriptional regulator
MISQISIFPEDPTANYHGDNPESRKAFDDLLPRLSHLQEMVLDYAKDVSDLSRGLTVKSVRRDLNLQHQTASARITELKGMELLVPTSRRHEGCRVLEITDLGRRTLAAWQKGEGR